MTKLSKAQQEAIRKEEAQKAWGIIAHDWSVRVIKLVHNFHTIGYKVEMEDDYIVTDYDSIPLAVSYDIQRWDAFYALEEAEQKVQAYYDRQKVIAENEQKRKVALGKLTAEDIRLLGIEI